MDMILTKNGTNKERETTSVLREENLPKNLIITHLAEATLVIYLEITNLE